LDVFYTTRPDSFCVEVFHSCVKSDHYAVGINLGIQSAEVFTNGPVSNDSPECIRSRHIVYELNPDNLSVLSNALIDYNWSGIILALEECHSCTDFSSIYSDFIKVVKYLIHTHLPSKAVSFSNREPSFITPRIKILLRKRNNLRRTGKLTQVDELSAKIGKLIAENQSRIF